MLNQPTDIKLNSAGVTYVADSTPAGKGVILIFPAGASGIADPDVLHVAGRRHRNRHHSVGPLGVCHFSKR